MGPLAPSHTHTQLCFFAEAMCSTVLMPLQLKVFVLVVQVLTNTKEEQLVLDLF